MKDLVVRTFNCRGSNIPTTCYWLDIETRKVPAPKGWYQRMRWQPFLVGLAWREGDALTFTVTEFKNERELIDELNVVVEYRYTATRDFDEMVLKGRFVNARHGFAAVPGKWPHLNLGHQTWSNIRKYREPKRYKRPPDIEPKRVPEEWAKGNKDGVARHCLKDVMELILRDPWCRLEWPLRRQLTTLVEQR